MHLMCTRARFQLQDEPGSFVKGEWIYPERQEPHYQRVPMEEDIVLRKGERRGFLIHTNCVVGIANRWPIGEGFDVGTETGAESCGGEEVTCGGEEVGKECGGEKVRKECGGEEVRKER